MGIKERIENLERQSIQKGSCHRSLMVIEVLGDPPLALPTESEILKHLNYNNLCKDCEGACRIIYSREGFGVQSKHRDTKQKDRPMTAANPETIDLINKLITVGRPNQTTEINQISVVSDNAKELTERILSGERTK